MNTRRWAGLVALGLALASAAYGCDTFRTVLVTPPQPRDGGGDGDGDMDGSAGLDGGDGGGHDASTDSSMPLDGHVDADANEGGASDTDADTDDAAHDAGAMCGVDGEDCCPDDPEKLQPGACGCGIADTDRDEDGTPDCLDACPVDPNKTEPWACGCGTAETLAASCSSLRVALRHRYRFTGSGTAVVDSVSHADGTVVGAALDDSSTLTLAGGTTDQHVDLPDGIISALTDATVEVWLEWSGGNAWQRVFDFGSSGGASGVTYWFVTPRAGTGTGGVRAVFSTSGTAGELRIEGASQLPTNTLTHLAVVFEHQSAMRLYVDGVLIGSVAVANALSDLNDMNNWLARSQYTSDPEFGGTYHELRIYGAALSADEITASVALGADPAFLE